jgi:amino acid permease
MTRTEKYDRVSLGAIAGFLVPLIIGLIVYLFSTGNKSLAEYIKQIIDADVITHTISLCVFPNIFLFLIFNRLDMLRATKGVLGITIFWAVLVFAVKFLS